MNLRLIFLSLVLSLTGNCQMASLSNPCDSKSKDFFPQLIVSASIEGSFCQLQIVNTGDFYRYTDFTFYKSIPISVLPRLGEKTEVTIQPNLPNGLYIDPNTGALSGTPGSPLERKSYTVYRKKVAVSQISIEIRDLIATKVYGQFGNFTCGADTNNGSCAAGSTTANNLSGPRGITTDNSGGVYITTGNRVLYYPTGQTTATRVYGQHGLFTCDIANAPSNLSCSTPISIAATTLSTPIGIFFDASNQLFVADSTNKRILVYQNDSTSSVRALGVPNFTTAGGGPTSASVLGTPIHMSPDSTGGFYLADSLDSRVIYFPKDANLPSEVYGQPNFVSNGATQTATGLNSNYGVVTDSTGGIYIADTGSHRVVYYPKGASAAIRVYGQLTFTAFAPPGSPTTNTLNNPSAVALDQSENLFVADQIHHRVLVYPRTNLTAGMSASAVVGQFGNFNCGADNNNGSCGIGINPNAENLKSPVAVHFDKQGRMYIADSGNNRVLVY
ncbi:NHL repeat-containing protein [Leptospira kanakyensis]|nr:NHL repeat-containing protein [Leptospira kanakyensis]